MRGRIKKIIAVLLAASVLVTCVPSIPAIAVETSTNDVVTTTYNFNEESQAESFNFYMKKSGIKGGYIDLKGTEGQLCFESQDSDTNKRAILQDNLNVKSVSADIYPYGETGKLDGGIILGDTGNGKISIFDSESVEFRLKDTGVNGTNVVLQVVRHTGNGASTKVNIAEVDYSDFNTSNTAVPMRMTIDIAGDYVLVTVQLISDKAKSVQTVIDLSKDKKGNKTEYTNEILSGYVGLGSSSNVGCYFDNLCVSSIKTSEESDTTNIYREELLSKIEELKSLQQGNYSDSTWNAFQNALSQAIEASNAETATDNTYIEALDTLCKAYDNLSETQLIQNITKTYTFETLEDALDFDFYHSESGGFMIRDGKLAHHGGAGEAKAILKGTNRTYESVSVDIYPDENGTMYAGIYLGASNVSGAVDGIDSLVVFAKTSDSDPSGVSLVIGSFPTWTSLKNVFASNQKKNSLFTEGVAEPLKLRVDIDGNNLTATLSNLSNPDIFVSTTYEYTGTYDLQSGAVGLRSMKSSNELDNFTVVYSGGTSNENTAAGTTSTSPATGDVRSMEVLGYVFVCVMSCAIIVFTRKQKKGAA